MVTTTKNSKIGGQPVNLSKPQNLIQESSVIRITLLSYDYKLLEQVLDTFIKLITLSGGSYKGPIHLPKRKHLTTLQSSPHVYKTALEQFGSTIYKSILDVSCGQNTFSSLTETDLDMKGGVEIKISVKKEKGAGNE